MVQFLQLNYEGSLNAIQPKPLMIKMFVMSRSQSICFRNVFHQVNFVTRALALVGQAFAKRHLLFNLLPLELMMHGCRITLHLVALENVL